MSSTHKGTSEILHSRLDALNQWQINVGPSSQTVDQYYSSIGLAYRVVGTTLCTLVKILELFQYELRGDFRHLNLEMLTQNPDQNIKI